MDNSGATASSWPLYSLCEQYFEDRTKRDSYTLESQNPDGDEPPRYKRKQDELIEIERSKADSLARLVELREGKYLKFKIKFKMYFKSFVLYIFLKIKLTY